MKKQFLLSSAFAPRFVKNFFLMFLFSFLSVQTFAAPALINLQTLKAFGSPMSFALEGIEKEFKAKGLTKFSAGEAKLVPDAPAPGIPGDHGFSFIYNVTVESSDPSIASVVITVTGRTFESVEQPGKNGIQSIDYVSVTNAKD